MSPSGINPTITSEFANKNEIDYFQIFFGDDIVRNIVCEINSYHLQTEQQKKIIEPRDLDWVNVEADEFYMFLAATMLMTHVKNNKI